MGNAAKRMASLFSLKERMSCLFPFAFCHYKLYEFIAYGPHFSCTSPSIPSLAFYE